MDKPKWKFKDYQRDQVGGISMPSSILVDFIYELLTRINYLEEKVNALEDDVTDVSAVYTLEHAK
jgi:hypothetical protein